MTTMTAPDLTQPVHATGLAARTYNLLRADGITTLGDLVACSEPRLRDIKGFGAKALDDVYALLAELGLQLGSAPAPADARPASPDQAPPVEADPSAPKLVHTPEGSRLEQLHAAYAEAKAELSEAEARFKTITDGIKSELAPVLQAVNAASVQIQTAGYQPLQLTWVVTNRLDSKKLRRDLPDLAAEYTSASGSWRLAPAGAGAHGGESE